MSAFQLHDYLRRIGHAGSVSPDYATLAAISAAQVATIPFEGLNPFLGQPVRLDLPSIVDKLLFSRRGGYCYELNLLLKAALAEIGFHVTDLGARVRWRLPPESPLGPRIHALLLVDLDGARYLVDAGFGACLMDAPLKFQVGVEQRTAMGTFRLSEAGGQYYLACRQPDGWRMMYAFNLEPQLLADYELGNWYTSTSPDVPFTSVVVVERVVADARYKLINRRFITEARDGAIASECLLEGADSYAQTLADVFNIVPPIPADEILARIGD